MSTWGRICKGIAKSTPSDSAAYKIASATSSLIDEPMIISDVHLLSVIHRWFLFPHFKWCQLGDPEVGVTPSFQSRHMMVRYFLMMDHIESAMEDRWKSMVMFEGFKDTLYT